MLLNVLLQNLMKIKVQTNIAIQREPYVLVVWMWNKIIEHIHDNSLKSTIADMISMLPGCEITLAIYGLESYFRYVLWKILFEDILSLQADCPVILVLPLDSKRLRKIEMPALKF